MNNPLSQVGQTSRPDEAETKPDQQSGDAGAEARKQNQHDEATRHAGQPPRQAKQPLAAKTEIPDLEPGQAPPESSAGS